MFKPFQWHYRFKTEFCNPGKGQEKGHVEVTVGYSLGNNLNSLPIIDDLNTFNQNLHEEMLADRNRIHYEKLPKACNLRTDKDGY
jgi:transposase